MVSGIQERDECTSSKHPDLRLLRDCALGRLDEALSKSIERHLESCDECCQQLVAEGDETIAQSDTFVSLVRRSCGQAQVPPALRIQPGYELFEELGRGGMAVVYRARQLSLGRIVALKRIRSGESADHLELLRFRREAEAVSRLVHPAIVQVFDAGEQQNQPYLAMEFMPGGTLSSALAAAPLPFRDAAQLLKILAGAVAHAHSRGLVHRDLKPANVLLAVAPAPGASVAECGPKIADFGLAKSVDDLAHTRTGILAGTPGYMAPEQVDHSCSIGPLADIYALGAILYECLTGRPPFRGATALETLDHVRSLDPLPPSRLRPGCPRDLETICLKCLERKAARRYVSAEALGDELDRWLDGRPITARRTSLPERVLKWVRRRPMLTALLTVSTLALVALSSGGWITSRWLSAALRERTAAQLKAERHLRAARNAWNQNWGVSVDALADIPGTAAQQLDLLENAEREYRNLLSSDPENLETRLAFAMLLMTKADLLSTEQSERAEPFFRKAQQRIDALAAERPEEAEVREGAEMVRCHFGLHLHRQSRWAEAESLLETAAKNMQALTAARGSNPKRAAQLAEIFDFLALSCYQQGQGHKAEKYQQRAITSAREAVSHGIPSAEIARAASSVFHNRALHTTDVELRRELLNEAAEILEATLARKTRSRANRASLANVCLSLGTLGGDESYIARARELYLELSRQFPGDMPPLDGLARCDYCLAGMRSAGGQVGEAERLIDQALATRRQLTDLHPDNDDNQVRTAETLNHRGLVRAGLGRTAEAEADYRQALSMQELLIAKHPGAANYEFSSVATLVNFSELLRNSGRAADALPLADRAVAICQARLDAGAQDYQLQEKQLAAHGTRALTLQALGRTSDAITDWDVVVELSTEPARFGYRLHRALVLANVGRYQEATAEALDLAAIDGRSEADLYNLACVHGLAAKAVAQKKDLDDSSRTRLESEYIDQAISLIKRLTAAGYFADDANRRHVEADPDLELVRRSPRFAAAIDPASP